VYKKSFLPEGGKTKLKTEKTQKFPSEKRIKGLTI